MITNRIHESHTTCSQKIPTNDGKASATTLSFQPNHILSVCFSIISYTDIIMYHVHVPCSVWGRAVCINRKRC